MPIIFKKLLFTLIIWLGLTALPALVMADGVAVSLNPAIIAGAVNENFSVTLKASDVVNLDNMYASVNYDSGKLEYINREIPSDMATSGWDLVVDYCQFNEDSNPVPGCVNVLASNINFTETLTGTFDIATLNFKPLLSGASRLIFKADSSALYAAGSIEPMEASWNGADVNIAETAITDQAAVLADKEALSADLIKGTNSSLTNITAPLRDPLPISGENGSVISWASDAPLVVSHDGQTINRPSFANGNLLVNLTATISKGLISENKVFNLNVIKLPASSAATVTSLIYEVSDGGGGYETISRIPAHTSRGSFLSGLNKGEDHQTWKITELTNPVKSGDKLIVTSEDGATTVTYTLSVLNDNSLDITPPVLSAINVSGISINSALISWQTDEPALSKVEYGLTNSYGLSSVLSASASASHSVLINNLNSETLYHYRLISYDNLNNTSTSTDLVFTTLAQSQNNGGANSGSANNGEGSVSGGGAVILPPSPVYPPASQPELLNYLRTIPPASISPQVLGVKISNIDSRDDNSAEAEFIYNHNQFVALSAETRSLYLLVRSKSRQILNDQEKYALAYYIHNGAFAKENLSSKERADVLLTYLSTFNKLPRQVNDWEDILKIAKGTKPKEKNKKAEALAENIFKKIYGHAANLASAADQAALTMMAYGSRPLKRNLNSERNALAAFKYFLKRWPGSDKDWNTVRAIAYSGAKR